MLTSIFSLAWRDSLGDWRSPLCLAFGENSPSKGRANWGFDPLSPSKRIYPWVGYPANRAGRYRSFRVLVKELITKTRTRETDFQAGLPVTVTVTVNTDQKENLAARQS
jgi:hypothetical protein